MTTAIRIWNLISPIALAFLPGIFATLIPSDLEIPEPAICVFAIFLVFLIGLQGRPRTGHRQTCRPARRW